MNKDLLYFPATQRNREAIAKALAPILPSHGSVLEIGSGSGEHAVIFQKKFPGLLWQASDPEPSHCRSINAWIEYEKLEDKMPKALELNVLQKPWPLSDQVMSSLKAVIAINLIHIAPWNCCESLVEQASQYLATDGVLIFYGPFRRNGRHSSTSNRAFDRSLRQKNSTWGVRDLESLKLLCHYHNMKTIHIDELPTNNLLVSITR